MAFDKTQPTNQTKLRNVGTVIRPNWVAIEEADESFKPYAINFTNRNPLAASNDPSAIDDSYILYSKQSEEGEPELYGIDQEGNVVQITDQGSLGGPETAIRAVKIQFSDSDVEYDRNSLTHTYGRFNAAGTLLYGKGCNTERISTGVYRVTFDEPLENDQYVPVANPENDDRERMCKIGIESNESFVIRIVDRDFNPRNLGAFFQVVGGY